ncbi:peptide deformylase [Nitrospinota bacterium]
MAQLPILVYPDPVLREKCRAVEDIDDRIRGLVSDMTETVHGAPGVGLAAPQVGETLRIVVVDLSIGEDPDQLHVLVNPEIDLVEGKETEGEEGCLSLPEIFEKVKRPNRVRVRALNLKGKGIVLDTEGKLARVLHHEIEHLDGKLLLDRLNRLKRELVKRRLKKRAKSASVA